MATNIIKQRNTLKSRISFADNILEPVGLPNELNNQVDINTGRNKELPLDQDRPSALTPDYYNVGRVRSSRSSAVVDASQRRSSAEVERPTQCLLAALRFPGYTRSLACLAVAALTAVTFEFVLSDVGLTFQRLLLLSMQIFFFVFLFYAVAMYLRTMWTNSSSMICIVLSTCVAVEILLGYVVVIPAASVQPAMTFIVLLCVGGVGLFSSMDILRCAIVITGISFVRFLACTMLVSLPRWVRPISAYLSGVIGVVAARYTVFTLSSTSNVNVTSSSENKKSDTNDVNTHKLSSCNDVRDSAKVRRVSLPNLSKKTNVSTSVSMESILLMKVDGLLTDMIADPLVPRHILRGLRVVKTLLSPSNSPTTTTTVTTRRSKSIPLVSLSPSASSSSAAQAAAAADLPYSDSYISIYAPASFHRSLPVALSRCRSAGTWTTTTSATGMPSLESELFQRKNVNPCTESASLSRLDKSWMSFSDENINSNQSKKTNDASSSPDFNPNEERNETKMMSEFVVEDLRVNFSTASDQDTYNSNSQSRHSSSSSSSSSALTSLSRKTSLQEHRQHNMIACSDNDAEDDALKVKGGIVCVADKLQNSQFFDVELLNEWDYPIFDLAALAPDTLLSRVSYKIFKELGFFGTFSIPIQEFLNYFHALELGYHDNKYHNRIHATDVTHAVYYMTTQSVPEFVQIIPDDDYLSINEADKNKAGQSEEEEEKEEKCNVSLGSVCSMRKNFLPLELMALYTASAMHDYDHPGRTNAFLVATCNPLAILYNNRSVLENHHAASGWNLLLSDPRYAWLVNLNNAQFKRFRFLVIEAILSTDLARHFDIVAEFNSKVNEEESSGIDWTIETDRLIVSNMIIKMADINGPCKKTELHLQWTYRIEEEFYEQGDEEQRLSLPISPYMNRCQPQLAKLQKSFLTHLVAPLCNSLCSAGLLPARVLPDNDNNSSAQNDNNVKVLGERSSIVCPMIKNLEENDKMWTKKIEEETTSIDRNQKKIMSDIPSHDQPTDKVEKRTN